MNFLCSFHPISSSRPGRQAVEAFGLPPFIDGSCRREPDLESPFPSISALCRTSHFAPRLQPCDRIAWVTTKGAHGDRREKHWRLVAVLQVLARFESHRLAAAWYRGNGLPLPSNCMVDDNPPIPFAQTMGVKPPTRFGDPADPERVLRQWNAQYRFRANAHGVFLACEPLFLELNEPPAVMEADAAEIFERGRMPCTQTPPRISTAELERLMELARSTPRRDRRERA